MDTLPDAKPVAHARQLKIRSTAEPIYDTFVQRPYPGGLTYAGHPLACAAAVGALAEQHPSVGEMRGIGALWTLELIRDRKTREPLVPYAATVPSAAPMAALSAACLDRGLITFVFGNPSTSLPR